ncbi:hypothetical protein RHGRI_021199 [Rhododendron griersonianum]|uniref:Uncharacterized protein n=1 Tax=Rhododendron griersonianum TaxID=479676 RepID=A0AAV6JPM3_9ERIC|nr:hypothetical protein RHGRI_021199 [Rhododendron griersonianum]
MFNIGANDHNWVRSEMPSFGDVCRVIMGLQYRGNAFKCFMFFLSSVIALAMIFIGFASEGKEVKMPNKDKLMDAILFLVPISWIIAGLGNLLDTRDDEAPLLPIFRRAQDATDWGFEAYDQRAVYERDQAISNSQLLASVQMANINSERRVHELVLENRMLRSWVNC